MVRIIGNDRKTAVITYTLPWAMSPGIIADDFFSGFYPLQSNYVNPDGTSGVTAGLLDPATPHAIFGARGAGTMNHLFGNFITPMIPGTLGGGSAIALSCPSYNDPAYTGRMIVVSTGGGPVWIKIATLNSDTAALRKLLSSIRVLQPGPTTGWYDPKPAQTELSNPKFPCTTDTVKATLNIATRQ